MIETILKRLQNKKILIAGFGKEGKSSLAFINQFLPQSVVSIADFNPQAFDQIQKTELIHQLYSGQDYLKNINDYDLVLKSPGISLVNTNVDPVKVSSQTDLFLEAFHQQVIGVTGTKGKSTCSSLIHHLLSSAGFKSILTGNIGKPCFDSFAQIDADTKIVFELSAHQLQNIKHSPGIGVLLNIYQEHLDHFGTFEQYRQAKLNLVRFSLEKDVCIVHESLQKTLPEMNGQITFFPSKSFQGMLVPNSLPGAHNMLNIEAALLATKAAGLKTATAIDLLSGFKSLEHRLEYVGTFNTIRFYNDSIATIPEAAIAALNAINPVHYLILGGFDRGIDYTPLIDFMLLHPVEVVFLTGKAGARINALLDAAGYKQKRLIFEDLAEVFSLIKTMPHQNKTCLLSPAAASYDQYLNFEQRGHRFKQLAADFQGYD